LLFRLFTAGRPQYDTFGEATLITDTQVQMTKYLHLLTHTLPIESQFIRALPEHLNAEIILGTVTSVREALSWLSYTYLFARAMRNPQHYGIDYDDLMNDPQLSNWRTEQIVSVAKT